DMKLFKKFRGYLLVKTQVNGVYYGEMIFNKIKLDKYFQSLSCQV
ncbi:capsular biosynthesis protein, partial [Escherichia coli]|nr:capsular biosynthesis protein [Escherichia coli]